MTHQAVKLSSPKLTLFAFQLAYDLSSGSENPVDDAGGLWQKCQEIGRHLGIAELVDFPERLQLEGEDRGASYRELLPERALFFQRSSFFHRLPLAGEVYPLQLHDTYAIDLTFRYPHSTVNLEQVRGLNPQQFFATDFIQASLGQSLLFWATPTEVVEDLPSFADACAAALNLGTLKRRGEFVLFGSPIFEYNNERESCHLLVWFNCDSKTLELEAEAHYYRPLLKLLCYRHKICYVYQQSRYCDRAARQDYSQLENTAIALSEEFLNPQQQLATFKTWLRDAAKLSFDYERYLRDLAIHQTTIRVNTENYQGRLEELQSIALAADSLSGFEEFLTRARDLCLEQIAVDIAYLTPGKALFRQMVETIRGLVEIDQAERDRARLEREQIEQNRQAEAETKLQDTLQALGVGIAAGSIFASSVEMLTQDWYLPNGQKLELPFSAPHPFLITLFGSAAVSVAAWKLAQYWIQKRRSRPASDRE